MRGRRAGQEEIAEIARRRLELLSAELAGLRSSLDDADSGVDPEVDASGGGGGATRATMPTPGTGRAAPVEGGGTEAGVRHVPGPEVQQLVGRHARRPVPASGRAAGFVHDRLPPTLQGRVALTPGHLTVVALLVAGALAVTAWWVVRADGSATVVPAATWADDEAPRGNEASAASGAGQPPAALVTPAGAEPASASDPGATASAGPAEVGVVVVDVTGRVRRPGIAELPLGSRVVDALEAAGGPRRGVDLTSLNLARVLVDGEQIVVGVPPPPGVAAPAASAPSSAAAPGGSTAGSGALVNINTAGQAELEELPGVGPVTATSIVQWRTEHGPFTSVDELMEVSGIGEATLAEIAPHVTL